MLPAVTYTRALGMLCLTAVVAASGGLGPLANASATISPTPTADRQVEPDRRAEHAADLERARGQRGLSPDRIVVVYSQEGQVDGPIRAQARQLAGGHLLRAKQAPAHDVIRVDGGTAAAAAASLRGRPGIADAYPDRVVGVTAMQDPSPPVNDPYYGNQWGLLKIQAPSAWVTTQGAGVPVAVLDCGIHADHPDLAGKVIATANFSSSPTTDDRCAHGTYVAGIIAASANNAIGIAGVAPGALLLNGKFLDDTANGFLSDLDLAITWAADQGARVINISSSGDGPCPMGTQQAANYAWSKGSVLVAATGNTGFDQAGTPANCANVIGVTATDQNDQRAPSTNAGTDTDLAAPGVSIFSTLNPDLYGIAYAAQTGTSMAAPHVAGAAALVWAAGTGNTPASVQAHLFNSADRVTGTGTLWQAGRVNAQAAVASAVLGGPTTTVTQTPSPTETATATATATPTATATSTPTATTSPSPTATETVTALTTASPTATKMPDSTATPSATATPTATDAPSHPSHPNRQSTQSPTPTRTPALKATPTRTPTFVAAEPPLLAPTSTATPADISKGPRRTR